MPDKAEKEARKRRRLQRRKGALAEPLQSNETVTVEQPEENRPEEEAVEQQGTAAIEESPDHGPAAAGASEATAAIDEQRTPPAFEREHWTPEPAATPSFAAAGPSTTQQPFPDILSNPRSAHSSPRARGWTAEPALMALLVVTLIILAIDTYFTIRLNGFSDRLSAMASAPNAAPVGADRPWVGADRITTVAFSGGGQPVTTMHIVNSGRAPALDLRSNTVGSLRSATTSPPDIPQQKGPLATTGVLFPNMGGDLTFFKNTRALTAEEATNVQSGKYVLWLAGRLDYKDSKGQAHETTFRYRYNPQMNAFVAAPSGNSAN
jgi:hypothetical protein